MRQTQSWCIPLPWHAPCVWWKASLSLHVSSHQSVCQRYVSWIRFPVLRSQRYLSPSLFISIKKLTPRCAVGHVRYHYGNVPCLITSPVPISWSFADFRNWYHNFVSSFVQAIHFEDVDDATSKWAFSGYDAHSQYSHALWWDSGDAISSICSKATSIFNASHENFPGEFQALFHPSRMYD